MRPYGYSLSLLKKEIEHEALTPYPCSTTPSKGLHTENTCDGVPGFCAALCSQLTFRAPINLKESSRCIQALLKKRKFGSFINSLGRFQLSSE